jgi:hypothetical protein
MAARRNHGNGQGSQHQRRAHSQDRPGDHRCTPCQADELPQELAAQIISILGAAGQETGPAAVPPVAPAQEREAVRRSRRPHELRAPVAAPDRELAITPDAVEPQEVEWTPATGSSRDAVRAAALPSSPGQADEGAAEPSPQPAWRWTGPLNPPQATCDEQGRLIMPDRTEYNERIRKGMGWDEIGKRDRD